MRIALAGDWFLPRLGGIELQVRDLALGLRSRGHDVEVITPVPGPASVDGIPVHRLGAPRLAGAGTIFTADGFRRIAAQLERGRYDVVHVHFGIVAPAAWGATRIAVSQGRPTVATFHSVLRRFELPLRAVGGLMGARDWPVHWSAVSSTVAASMAPLTGRGRVAILPNGIDGAWWARRSLVPARTAGDPLRIVSAMRLHPRKRPQALVRAVAEVVRTLPARRMEVRVFGDGGGRRPLERAIVAAGLGDVVRLEGWSERTVIRAALHDADLFVMPSRLEAFGIAALEARCAGVPVVAMRESGARDFLTDGTDAVLVDSDAGMATALLRLASDPAELRRLADGCRALPSGADWGAVLDRHERAYTDASVSPPGRSTHR